MKYQIRFRINPEGRNVADLNEALKLIALEFNRVAKWDFMILHSSDFKVGNLGYVKAGNVFGFIGRYVVDSTPPEAVAREIIRAFEHNGFRKYTWSVTVYNFVGDFSEIAECWYDGKIDVDYDTAKIANLPDDEIPDDEIPF